MTARVHQADASFDHWPSLVRLLQEAFAYQNGRIDPPSSLDAMDTSALAAKSRGEALFLASDGPTLVGCVFAQAQANALFIGKFAVTPKRQGQGVGRLLLRAVELHAQRLEVRALTLNTRIELTENHRAFAAMGFVKTAEHAHPGYSHPTYISMRKTIDPGPRSAIKRS
jgi:GNAT superfamily N-acetyltransferase